MAEMRPQDLYRYRGGPEARIRALYGVLADTALEIRQLEEIQEQIAAEEAETDTLEPLSPLKLEAHPGNGSLAGYQVLQEESGAPSRDGHGLERLYVFIDRVGPDGAALGDQASQALRLACLSQPYSVLKQCQYACYAIDMAAAPFIRRDNRSPVQAYVHLVRASSGSTISAAEAFLAAVGGKDGSQLFLSSPRWREHAGLDIFLKATGGLLQKDLMPFLFPVTTDGLKKQFQKRLDAAQASVDQQDRFDTESVARFFDELSAGYVNQAYADRLITAADLASGEYQLVILEPFAFGVGRDEMPGVDALTLRIRSADFIPLLNVIRDDPGRLNQRITGITVLPGALRQELDRTFSPEIFATMLRPLEETLIKDATEKGSAVVHEQAEKKLAQLRFSVDIAQESYRRASLNIERTRAARAKQIEDAQKELAELQKLAQEMSLVLNSTRWQWSQAIEIVGKAETALAASGRKLSKIDGRIQKLQVQAGKVGQAERDRVAENLDAMLDEFGLKSVEMLDAAGELVQWLDDIVKQIEEHKNV